MPTMAITNPEIDSEAATLVTKTWNMITPHWRNLIPELAITVAKTSFNKVPALREFCAVQEKQSGWEKSAWNYTGVICPDLGDGHATLWVYYSRNSGVSPSDYYFQKELFAVLGKILWFTSQKVRDQAKQNATGLAVASDGAAYMAFRDSFSRFFLNPEYLKERKEDAWSFISRIDQAIKRSTASTKAGGRQ